MTIVPDDPANEQQPGKPKGLIQVLLVMLLFIAGALLVFYFTAWRVPNRRKHGR